MLTSCLGKLCQFCLLTRIRTPFIEEGCPLQTLQILTHCLDLMSILIDSKEKKKIKCLTSSKLLSNRKYSLRLGHSPGDLLSTSLIYGHPSSGNSMKSFLLRWPFQRHLKDWQKALISKLPSHILYPSLYNFISEILYDCPVEAVVDSYHSSAMVNSVVSQGVCPVISFHLFH